MRPAREEGGGRPRPIAVLGMGNVLMGDDGAGPFVVAYLQAHYAFPDSVEVAEIGTPGLDLVPHLDGRRAVIVVDTVKADAPPGTVTRHRGDQLAAAPPTLRLGPHDPGLAESLATLRLAGTAPETVVVVGIVPERTGTGIGLSSTVRAAVPEAAAAVVEELAALGAAPEPLPEPLPLDPWWARPT